jgi:hypothetical protein
MHPVVEKLTRSNFSIWKALVLTTLRGAQLADFLDDKIEAPAKYLSGANDKKMETHNPEFVVYIAKQNLVLNFLLSSLSREMLEYVASYATPQEVWKNLLAMTSSQSWAYVINTWMALSTNRKNNQSIAQYVGKVKTLANDMAATRKKLDDEDLVGYIIAGLDSDFDFVISAVSARVETILISVLYGQLIHQEQRQELGGKEYTMVNSTSQGQGGPPVRGSPDRGRGRGRGRIFSNNREDYNWVECQLCGKKGHIVMKCFKRFDWNYTGEEKSAAAATSYEIDNSWYATLAPRITSPMTLRSWRHGSHHR